MKKAKLLLMVILVLSQCLQAQNFEVINIMNNGSTSKKVNIVFLGDGYQSHEMNKYLTDVRKVTDSYFKTAPYNSIKTSFNVFAIKAPSNASGAGRTPQSPVDNYFGSTYGYAGMDRLLVASKTSLVTQVANANTPYYDQIFLIVNDSKYGGSGGEIATFSTHTDALGLALHEAGHSYAKLADEYWAGSQYAAEKANLTQNGDAITVKWNKLIGKNGVGVYKHEESPSWYRPHQNCKMRYLNSTFCEVCQNEIKTITNDLLGNSGGGTLGVPTNLSASNITSTSFSANWNTSTGATSYDVQLYENGTWTTKGSPATNTYNFTGLQPNSEQHFRVRSVNSTNSSDYSNYLAVNLTSNSTIPATPSGLNSSNVTATSFTANWNQSTGATSYDTQLWENGAWKTKGSSTANTYSFTGLVSASTQYFRVRATNSKGSSEYSDYSTVKLLSGGGQTTIPSTPSGLNASNILSSSFTANWTASSGATSYDVQLWENGAWKTKESSTTNTYNFTGLASASTQYFRIRATNSAGSSDYSNWKSIQLGSTQAPPILNIGYKNLVIYPNPVSDVLYIKGNLENPFIRVMDIYGNIFLQKTLGDNLMLDLSHLDPKIYILNIQSKEINKTIRFIKK
ncbi:M64 family metallopeptidase [Aquimarina sediminis]|uniref:M64 family metallopeptidase n=1 Tax=Aquimarina sediminis TaxID=2070536 RepID=UPI000CA065D3|nr:M64 family metallopeptidase [Aquimarina sediminis]